MNIFKGGVEILTTNLAVVVSENRSFFIDGTESKIGRPVFEADWSFS